MNYWLILVLLVPILILIYFYLHNKFTYWSKRGINGPKPVPLLGNVWQPMVFGQVVTELKWVRKYGKVYGIYSGSKPDLVVADHELAKKVMVKDFNQFVNRRASRTPHEIWSRNLFNLEGDDWKRVRTITSPSFTSGKLRGMNSLMSRAVDKLADYFDKICTTKNGIFNTKEVVSGFTIDVIASTSFATETNANDDRSKKNAFVYHGMRLLVFSPWRILAMALLPVTLRKWIGLTLAFAHEDFNFFRNLAEQVVKGRKETGCKRNDLVQLLLDANDVMESDLQGSSFDHLTASAEKDDETKVIKKLSPNSKVVKNLDDAEIIAQCIIFFVAGFETTASTITHCFYELAANPDVQDRLHQELSSALEGIEMNSDQYYDIVTSKIAYLDAVVKETLRKYPPLPRVERRANVDRYQLGGLTLHKEQVVIIATYAIHHNSEYYPDPERFNPDRFMPENKHLLVPYTYLPFGQGPRNCIGMRFAYQEIKLCLAKLVPLFRLVKAAKTPDKLHFSKIGLLSVKPFPLKVVKRN